MDINLQKQSKKKEIGRWGKFHLYLVDDEAIRNKAEYAEEFSDYGVNLGKKGLPTINFKFIPSNEIWIAKSIKIGERHFIIDNSLAYIKAIERGTPPDKAYDIALRYEKSARTKDAIQKLRLKNNTSFINLPHKEIAEKIYVSEYTAIKDVDDTVKIYLVEGEYVRDLHKTDYVEGGHGYVYPWIPENEIWVDSSIDSKEIPVIVLHEFTERTLMKYKKISYARAHIAASKVEFEHRGIFDKKSLNKLNKRFVLSILLKNIKV